MSNKVKKIAATLSSIGLGLAWFPLGYMGVTILQADRDHKTGTASSPQAVPNPANTTPAMPLVVAGYNEIRLNDDDAASGLVSSQANYISSKAELQSAINKCNAGAPDCNANVRAFAEMIERVKNTSDPMRKIQIINGGVNMLVNYDMAEADRGLTRRSLYQTLVDEKGVCDEFAQLKLFALEAAGFSPDDVRWMLVAMYDRASGNRITQASHSTGNHSVAVVHVNGNVWVLNDLQKSFDRNQPLYRDQVALLMRDDSAVESAATALNVSGRSEQWGANTIFIPLAAYNATERADYDSNIRDTLAATRISSEVANATAVTAKPSMTANGEMLASASMMRTLWPAAAAHYDVRSVTSVEAIEARFPTKRLPEVASARSPLRPALEPSYGGLTN